MEEDQTKKNKRSEMAILDLPAANINRLVKASLPEDESKRQIIVSSEAKSAFQ